MDKLLRCPFCGGKAHVMEDERFAPKPYDFPKWYIQCMNCGVRTAVQWIDLAVKKWNRRAGEAE